MFRFKNIALYVFFFPFLSFLSHLVDFLEFFYPSHILIFALLSKWWLSQLSPCLRGRIAPNGYCSGYRLKFQTSSISDRNASIIKELWRWRSIQLCFCCKMNSWLGQTWPEIMGTFLTRLATCFIIRLFSTQICNHSPRSIKIYTSLSFTRFLGKLHDKFDG